MVKQSPLGECPPAFRAIFLFPRLVSSYSSPPATSHRCTDTPSSYLCFCTIAYLGRKSSVPKAFHDWVGNPRCLLLSGWTPQQATMTRLLISTGIQNRQGTQLREGDRGSRQQAPRGGIPRCVFVPLWNVLIKGYPPQGTLHIG